jgi:hypothetical protein
MAPWKKFRVTGAGLRLSLRARRFNVVNLLAAGALVVSIGAAATVIGIAEVQIASAKGGSGDLWSNSWFVLGLTVGLTGLVLFAVAICANSSQTKARREFPDIRITIFGLTQEVDPLQEPVLPGRSLLVRHLKVQVHNQETSRTANLGFILVGDLDHELPHGGKEYGFYAREQAPWNVGPGLTEHGTISFDTIPPDGFVLAFAPHRVQVTDFGSRRSVLLQIGQVFFDKSNWKAL